MKKWYNSKTVWLGVLAVAASVVSAAAEGATWQTLTLAGFGALGVFVRTLTTEGLLKGRKPIKVTPWAVDLSEALPDVEVIGHTTSGHTTRNPYTKRIVNGESQWIIEPRSDQWAAWMNGLHLPDCALRFFFPTITEVELNATLAMVGE